MGSSPRRLQPDDAFTALVEAHTSSVRIALVRVGVPARDVPDLVQEVFLKLQDAIGRGLDTRLPLKGWLKRTAYTIARDAMRLARNARELVTPTGEIEAEDQAPTPEAFMEKIDLHKVVHSVLDELPFSLRSVLVMSDMDDLSMEEVIGILGIPERTGYARLKTAREEFERAWNEKLASGHAAFAPFALWKATDLIEAGRSIPEVPQSFRDDLMRRLALPLDPGLLSPTAGAVAAGTAAKVGAAVVATKAGALTLTLLWVVLAGTGLYAARHASPPGPTAAAPANHDHLAAGATPASRPPGDPSMASGATLGAASARLASSAASPVDEELKLLETARADIDRGDALGALATLAQVRNPGRAERRDELRGLAMTLLVDGGGP